MKSKTESFSLPAKPEGVFSSLVERFNSGDASALMELHEPRSVFVENNGQLLTDRAAIAARLERDVRFGPPWCGRLLEVHY